ncbi:hypothetical protein JVU11DRAFT_11319 [Chiua virens]|nr:hypothetical protein JVU11DRAFT_11319 [Chiua virens]
MDMQCDGEDLRWYIVPPVDTVCPFYQGILRRDMDGLFGHMNHAVNVVRNDVTPVLRPITATGSEGTAKRTGGVDEMAGKYSPASITTDIHSCQAVTLCYWTSDGKDEICGAKITCKSVPAHLGDAHHIRKLDKNSMIYCRWEGCDRRMKPKNFSRHVRECHVGHCREQKSCGN